jgi:hypothetical protein
VAAGVGGLSVIRNQHGACGQSLRFRKDNFSFDPVDSSDVDDIYADALRYAAACGFTPRKWQSTIYGTRPTLRLFLFKGGELS